MKQPVQPCPECYDAKNDRITGMTRETATIIREVDGKFVTHKQGSGCPECQGLGVIECDI